MNFKKLTLVLLTGSLITTSFACQRYNTPDTATLSTVASAEVTTQTASPEVTTPDATTEISAPETPLEGSLEESLALTKPGREMYSAMLSYFYENTITDPSTVYDQSQLASLVSSDLERYLFYVYFYNPDLESDYKFGASVSAEDVQTHLACFYGLDNIDLTVFGCEPTKDFGIIYNSEDDTVTAYRSNACTKPGYGIKSYKEEVSGISGTIVDRDNIFSATSAGCGIEYGAVDFVIVPADNDYSLTVKSFSCELFG